MYPPEDATQRDGWGWKCLRFRTGASISDIHRKGYPVGSDHALHFLQHETLPSSSPFHWRVKNCRLRQWVWNRELQQDFYKEIRKIESYSDSHSSSSVTSGVISNFYSLSTKPIAKQLSHLEQHKWNIKDCFLAGWDGCIPRMIFVVVGSEHQRSGSFQYRFQ